MCIAIVLKPLSKIEKDITKTTIETCWENNPDGGGFAYTHNGRVVIKKGFVKHSKLIKHFFRARTEAPNSYFLLHLRIASRGAISTDNCHPHWIKQDEMAMIHNGTIQHLGKRNEGTSDSVLFAQILSTAGNFIDNIGIRFLIEQYIGTGKVAVLTKDNIVSIYNESNGLWKNGIWFSNSSFVPKPKTQVSTGYSPASGGYYDSYTGTYKNQRYSSENRCKCGAYLAHAAEYLMAKCFNCMGTRDKISVNNYYGVRFCTKCQKPLYVSVEPVQWGREMCEDCSKSEVDKKVAHTTPTCELCSASIVGKSDGTICRYCRVTQEVQTV